MATSTIYAGTNDGTVTSTSTNYTSARNGTGFTVDTGGDLLYTNQDKNGANYQLYESFLEWSYGSTTGRVCCAQLRPFINAAQAMGTSRTLEMRENDWGGGTLTSADWEAPAGILAGALHYQVLNAQSGTGRYAPGGQIDLASRLRSGVSPLRELMFGDRMYAGVTPTAAERTEIVSANYSGTNLDPALIFTEFPACRLFGNLGAQAQLSDGTHVFIEAKDETANDMVLKHRTRAGTVTTVYDLDFGTVGGDLLANGFGAQTVALVADSSDNLYLIAPQGSTANAIVCKGFTKGGGYTWTPQSTISGSLSTVSGSYFNNIVAAWHNTGANGTIVVVAQRSGGIPGTNDAQYALLNCQSVLAGSGSLFRNSGNARGVLVSSATNASNYTSYANETGNWMDIAALNATRGVVTSHTPESGLGSHGWGQTYRYTLDVGGGSITSSAAPNFAESGTPLGTKDAEGKARLLRISDSVYCSVTSTNGDGLQVSFWQNSGTTTFTHLGTTIPYYYVTPLADGSTYAASSAWDVVYDAGASKVYLYFFQGFPSLDQQKLYRTSIDVNTYSSDGNAVLISGSVGAAASDNWALRVNRGPTNSDQVLITVANETSGGAHSTIYLTDTLNIAPNAPTLTPKANYDATAAATFAWTFSDPNAGDTQTAYQFDVDTSGGTGVVDTGKIVSGTSSRNVTGGTLTNGVNYLWRVRTWDSADVVGPYSPFSAFSTSAAGTVTVTDPATDNQAGINTDDYLVKWSVSGTTQVAYRVVVTRVSNGATLVNTGWVTSVATQYNVTGMLTGVEYNVAVTVRNGAAVESGTGNRRITPDYDNVPGPMITATATNDGYILIQVTNPTPSGDDPAATANEIYRRRVGDLGSWVKIATIDPNGEHRDYTAASNTAYQFLARATAP